jgi:type II secretory pathway component PulF
MTTTRGLTRRLGTLSAMGALDDGRHRAEFYRMWRTAYGAGFTHPKSLETMGPRPSAPTEGARLWLLDGTRRGEELAGLLRSGGDRFEEFERALLILGEESGSLDRALELLGTFYTRKHKLMMWVKSKMAYPFFTALAACFIAPFPLLFYGNTSAYLVAAGSGVTILFLFSGTLVAAVAARYGRKPPLVRARLARALVTAVEAGLTLPQAIRLSADASANAAVRAHIGRFSERELSTTPISETLAGCPHITPEFAAVLATAERTGDFSALGRLAELYEDGFR